MAGMEMPKCSKLMPIFGDFPSLRAHKMQDDGHAGAKCNRPGSNFVRSLTFAGVIRTHAGRHQRSEFHRLPNATYTFPSGVIAHSGVWRLPPITLSVAKIAPSSSATSTGLA